MEVQCLTQHVFYLVIAVVMFVLTMNGLKKWNCRLIQTKRFPELLFSLASVGDHFTSFLNIHKSIVGKVELGKGKLGFSYLIPRHISTHEGTLDLGGTLALADEISTILLVCEDKTHRAGVSVSLTGEVLHPEELKAGVTVWVETSLSKVGAALGFAEVSVWKTSTQKVLLARVSHIKYMKTGGLMWDLASPLMPSAALLAHRWGWGGGHLPASEYLPLSQLLNVQASAAPEQDSNSSESGRSINCDFELVTHHKIQNHFKSLHGGALSMAITDAVMQYHASRDLIKTGERALSLRWMEMQYLSPCKGRIRISISPQDSSPNESTSTPHSSPLDNTQLTHSFRVMVYACGRGQNEQKCLAHGSVLFF